MFGECWNGKLTSSSQARIELGQGEPKEDDLAKRDTNVDAGDSPEKRVTAASMLLTEKETVLTVATTALPLSAGRLTIASSRLKQPQKEVTPASNPPITKLAISPKRSVDNPVPVKPTYQNRGREVSHSFAWPSAMVETSSGRRGPLLTFFVQHPFHDTFHGWSVRAWEVPCKIHLPQLSHD